MANYKESLKSNNCRFLYTYIFLSLCVTRWYFLDTCTWFAIRDVFFYYFFPHSILFSLFRSLFSEYIFLLQPSAFLFFFFGKSQRLLLYQVTLVIWRKNRCCVKDRQMARRDNKRRDEINRILLWGRWRLSGRFRQCTFC